MSISAFTLLWGVLGNTVFLFFFRMLPNILFLVANGPGSLVSVVGLALSTWAKRTATISFMIIYRFIWGNRIFMHLMVLVCIPFWILGQGKMPHTRALAILSYCTSLIGKLSPLSFMSAVSAASLLFSCNSLSVMCFRTEIRAKNATYFSTEIFL